ncbi:hypothetical protein BN1723_019746, partial [Verticillium longisporum]
PQAAQGAHQVRRQLLGAARLLRGYANYRLPRPAQAHGHRRRRPPRGRPQGRLPGSRPRLPGHQRQHHSGHQPHEELGGRALGHRPEHRLHDGLYLYPPARHPPPQQHRQQQGRRLQGRLQLAVHALARLLVHHARPALHAADRGRGRQA